jgi:hypothetical protein
MKAVFSIVSLLLLVCPAPASAQNADQTELIQALTARIDQLERRIAQLEAARSAPPPAPAPPVAPSAMDILHGLGQAEPEDYPALKIAGFSDFTFSGTDQPGTHSGFTEGQFILHLNSNLSPKVSFLGELSLSARSDASTGAPAAAGFNAEVERSIIRFEHNDRLKLSFGRYHTPINYWNTAFHHGQWLQTTVSRPEMTQFGGKFIPVHFVGALVEGAVPAGGLNFNYSGGVGNGRGNVISRGGDAGDNNSNRAWLSNVFIRPDRFYGLQVGASIYRDKTPVAAGHEFREWISAAHVVWNRETPEIIAEFANVRHQDVGNLLPHTDSQAYYIQTAYRLPGFARLWKPYYRFEYIHIPKTDEVFQGVPNLAGSVVGVRYDLSNFAAMKFEYRHQRRGPGLPRINAGFLQTSFTF